MTPSPWLSWRNTHSLTQEALAKKVGVNRATISHIENGRRHPSIELLAQLRVELKLSDQDVAQIVAEAAPKTIESHDPSDVAFNGHIPSCSGDGAAP